MQKTKTFHNLLIGISVLPALMIMPAMATEVISEPTEYEYKLFEGKEGSVFHNKSTLSIADDSEFKENSAKNGGAIYNNGDLTIGKNVSFEANSATLEEDSTKIGNMGGAIYSEGTNTSKKTIKIGESVKFIDNEAGAGGAVYLFGANDLEIGDNAEFDGNIANGGGGALAVVGKGGKTDIENGEVSVSIGKNAKLINNVALYGGAINNNTGANLTLDTGALFEQNSVDLHGGAVANLDKFNATGATFHENEAEQKGGAIYNWGNGIASVKDSTFERNMAENGGAIYNEATAEVKLDNSSLNNNSAKNGGAIYNNGKLTIGNNVSFEGNSATLEEDSTKIGNMGGAIYSEGTSTSTNSITIGEGVKFIGNEADAGGAVYLFGANNAEIGDNAEFDGNTAKNNGGAITIVGKGGNTHVDNGDIELSIGKNAKFTNNSASFGGAINNNTPGAVVNIDTGALFEGNTATTSVGGAVANLDKFNATGATFTSNTAKAGGAIYNWNGGNVSLENATFTGNKAEVQGGAIYNDATSEVKLSGTNTFTSNSAKTGSDIFNNGNLTIATGTTTIDGGIAGNGSMTIANGATLNIGDTTVEQKSITLDGNMIANLTDRGEKAIVTAEQFGGDGILSLIAKNGGNYKVFGNAVFGGEKEIQTESAVYNLDWNKDGTVNLELKTVEDIAEDNNLSTAASQTVSNLVNSTSDKLNDFGLLAQESLSNGDAKAVEKAHKAINPEETSVLQSVASHIQGTVSKLAGNRMSESANGVWATGLFNKSKLNGGFNGYNRGISAGIDGKKGAFTLGAGYAFNHSDLTMHSRDTEIDSNTIFAYGQYKPSQWYANATLNYTMSDYTEKGSALGMAIDSDYKANSFGGQVMTGYDFANGFTPEAGVRYMHIAGDTYTNSLGIKNKIDSTDYLTAILGGKYAKSFAISEDLALKPEVRLAAKYDLMSDEAVTTVSMPGIAAYSVKGDRLNRFGGEAGLGVTMSYKDVDLSLTYDIEVRKDYTSQTGMLKAKYNF